MTPADIIDEVRALVQDNLAPYRYSDTVLLGFVNQALKRMSMLRPDLFGVIGEIPTQAGNSVQQLPVGAFRLIDIFQVKDGDVVTEVDRETMSRNAPGWMSEAAGTPVNFMRHVKNPDQFFLYPRPSSNVVLIGEYAQVPTDYGLTDEIVAPPSAFFPALVDCTVFLSQSVDNEHVNSGRAKLFLDSFVQALGASLQSRAVTDTKAAGMKPSRRSTEVGEVI